MSKTRVFISSTCFDLKSTRKHVARFISSIGYEPILSDDGDVPYNHRVHTHDACLIELEKSDLVILIIGNRHGGLYNNTGKSITRMEYETAKKSNIPVIAFVLENTYKKHGKYTKSKKNEVNNYSDEMIKIFAFIDDVRRSSIGNGIISFRNKYNLVYLLKKQLSGMVHDFLKKPDEKLQHYHVHLRVDPAPDGKFKSSYFGSGAFFSPKAPAQYVDRIQSNSGELECNYYPNYKLLNCDEHGDPRNKHTVDLVVDSETHGNNIEIFGKVSVITTLRKERGGVGLHIPYDCDYVVFVIDLSLLDIEISEEPRARLLNSKKETDYDALKTVKFESEYMIVGKKLNKDDNILFSWGDHN